MSEASSAAAASAVIDKTETISPTNAAINAHQLDRRSYTLEEGENEDMDDSVTERAVSLDVSSKKSAYSDYIHEASRRVMERAAGAVTPTTIPEAGGMAMINSDNFDTRSTGTGRSSTHSSRRRRKKKNKQSSSLQRQQIRDIVQRSSQSATFKLEEQHVKRDLNMSYGTDATEPTSNVNAVSSMSVASSHAKTSGNDTMGSSFKLPTTSEILDTSNIDPDLYSHCSDQSSLASGISAISSSSAIPRDKQSDKSYLATSAQSKFQKGLQYTHSKRYSLARSKFRGALKARVLLHEDIHHLSLAPVHEMIGLVERKLGDYEKSKVHLEAALEICEGALVTEEEKSDQPSEQKRILQTNIDRINKTIEVVKNDEKGLKIEEVAPSPYTNMSSAAEAEAANAATAAIGRPPTERRTVEERIEEAMQRQEQKRKEHEERIEKEMQKQEQKRRLQEEELQRQQQELKAAAEKQRIIEKEMQMQEEKWKEHAEELRRKEEEQRLEAEKKLRAEEERKRRQEEEELRRKEEERKQQELAEKERRQRQELAEKERQLQEQAEKERRQREIDEKERQEQELIEKEKLQQQQNLARLNARKPPAKKEATPPQEQRGDIVWDESLANKVGKSDVDLEKTEEEGDAPQASEEEGEVGGRRNALMRQGASRQFGARKIIEEPPSQPQAQQLEPKEAKNEADPSSTNAVPDDDGSAGTDEEQIDPDLPHDISITKGLYSIHEEKASNTPKTEKSKRLPPPPPQSQKPLTRMSTFNQEKLRETYYSQSEKGNFHYTLEDYPTAIACFNDARYALLMIAGNPENKSQRENPSAVTYAKLRDRINSALLSERITDCHVQKFFRGSYEIDATDNYSHINYGQASITLSDVKKMLNDKIELHYNITKDHEVHDESSINSFEEEKNSDVNDLKELLNEATLALARIFFKQGCVYAKLENHFMALDLFKDSISQWVEAANNDNDQSVHGHGPDFSASDEDSLILETHEMMSSYYEANNISRQSFGSDSLKKTAHLKALSTSLQMSLSHYAIGVDAAMEEDGIGGDLQRFEVALEHHLHALILARDTSRLRAAFTISSLSTLSPKKNRMTTRARDISVLVAQTDTEEMTENIGAFMKTCTLVQTQQEICIAHACLCLGHRALSKKWLLKAIDGMHDLGLTGWNEEAEVALFILSVLLGNDDTRGDISSSLEMKKPSSIDSFHLYETGLPLLTEGYSERTRVTIHFALAAFKERLYGDTMTISEPAIETVCSSPNIPGYFVEVLHAIDARIIINVKKENIDGAVEAMNRRLDVVSRWVGKTSIVLAKDLHRLGCLHSAIGNHDECVQNLEKCIQLLGSNSDDQDLLNSMKLLATTHDVLNDTENAISQYECVLAMEEDFIEKAKLTNAIANLHIQVGGQCHLAVEYLEESLGIQQKSESEGDENALLLIDTMILYGNAMAAQRLFSQAIHWYESALNSNSDKSPIHPSNLRAWYNKGVTLFRSGDIIGAGHAFGIILDEVEKVSTVASGTAFVLNAIGSIYFANKDYAGAIDHFKESLSLEDDSLSPYQRAGTFCNIATAYYKMGNNEESEENFEEAMMAAKSAGETPKATEAIIMSNFARILCKRKLYQRAYKMFLNASSIMDFNPDDDLSIQCRNCAEWCRLKHSDQNGSDDLPSPGQSVIAEKPQFEASLIPITDGYNATRYSDAVYPWERKMLEMLGVQLTDPEKRALPSGDIHALCERARESLLDRSEDCRTEHALEFEGLLVEKFHDNFLAVKSFLDKEFDS